MARIIFDDALEEGEVLEMDGTADTDGGVNHFRYK